MPAVRVSVNPAWPKLPTGRRDALAKKGVAASLVHPDPGDVVGDIRADAAQGIRGQRAVPGRAAERGVGERQDTRIGQAGGKQPCRQDGGFGGVSEERRALGKSHGSSDEGGCASAIAKCIPTAQPIDLYGIHRFKPDQLSILPTRLRFICCAPHPAARPSESRAAADTNTADRHR